MFGLFPPNSKVTRFSRFHNQMTDFGRAGKCHFIHVHVPRDGRAGRGAKPRKQVDDAFRKACFHDQFSDPKRRQRRLLGGLHHHRISGGQRGRQLPRQHQHGKIPGDDLSHHAYGLMPGITEVLAVDGDCLAVNFIRPSREIAEARDRGRNIHRLRHRDRLAVVERLDPGQLISICLDEIGETVQQPSAFRG